jgi:hypothetical protein
MDALGAYALSCTTYFGVRYFLSENGRQLSNPVIRALFLRCFLPVIAFVIMVLFNRGLGSLDLYRKIAGILCWTPVAAAAFPRVVLRGGSCHVPRARLANLVGWGTLAGWTEIVLFSLIGLFMEVPGIIPSAFSLALFFGISVTVFVSPSFGIGWGYKSNGEIDDALFISLSTVKTHLASIFNKTGTRNRMEAARVLGGSDPPKV